MSNDDREPSKAAIDAMKSKYVLDETNEFLPFLKGENILAFPYTDVDRRFFKAGSDIRKIYVDVDSMKNAGHLNLVKSLLQETYKGYIFGNFCGFISFDCFDITFITSDKTTAKKYLPGHFTLKNMCAADNVNNESGLSLAELKNEYEYYPTPEPVVLSLLEHEKFYGSIWEPCCGNGAITKVLKSQGYKKILATDICDYSNHNGDESAISGVNFLETNLLVDNIITGPPFSIKDEIISHSLKLARRKIAMLLPSRAMDAKKRQNLFENCSRIYSILGDVKFHAGTELEYKDKVSWFIWDKESDVRHTDFQII